MASNVPRLVIAGLSGDSGKTIVSMSLLAACRRKAIAVTAFKKGPDYIDAAWLTYISGNPCRNLDTFMVEREQVKRRFFHHAAGSALAVIEGNRGLFDGKDTAGTHSTAELAKLTDSPVVLVVNCTKTTRTVAAMVKGCQVMDPGLKIAGVILNNIAGARHRQVISDAIESTCGLPVIGAIPKLQDKMGLIPGRHLGLVTPSEFKDKAGLIETLGKIASEYLDIDAIIRIAEEASSVEASPLPKMGRTEKKAKIGYFRDSVFTFYYPENIEALENAGAEMKGISSLQDFMPDDIDGLYIGGGFPETQAEKLTRNKSMMDAVRTASEYGMPIYAECGGLIYLCRSLAIGEKIFEMAGVFPVDLTMQAKPAGHGYAEAEVTGRNPFYETGIKIKGHEFHYSKPVIDKKIDGLTLTLAAGSGISEKLDGLVSKNTFATYIHTHADGNEGWAGKFVSLAGEYRKNRLKKTDGERVMPLRERAAS